MILEEDHIVVLLITVEDGNHAVVNIRLNLRLGECPFNERVLCPRIRFASY
jgi:hypothetical protein